MEDNVSIISRMENRVSCVITADFLNPDKYPLHGDDRLRIAGTKGVIEIMAGRCVLATDRREPEEIASKEGRLPTWRYLADALKRKGDRTYSTCETLRVARFMLAARDALYNGREVSI